jgi:FkbM family methyltransferase
MDFRRLKGKYWASWHLIGGRMLPSFSQAGEDKIIHYLFSHYLKKEKLSYLDIGANHPILFNNTYLFYIRGGSGVCIEPDPKYTALLRKHRRGDRILQAGIGFSGSSLADFYVFPGKQAAWNTFSKEEANKRMQEMGIEYTIRQQKLLDINETIAEYLGEAPDVLSVDAEGIDLEIIKSLDFNKYSPKVICVETVPFQPDSGDSKSEISGFMMQKGFYLYADTHINAIFCHKDLFPGK